uniref:Uncharacterized protein n=1 Tax=Romanomermis culicivorax TaxID=13658 RepID=A0A915KX90_ROMCU
MTKQTKGEKFAGIVFAFMTSQTLYQAEALILCPDKKMHYSFFTKKHRSDEESAVKYLNYTEHFRNLALKESRTAQCGKTP